MSVHNFQKAEWPLNLYIEIFGDQVVNDSEMPPKDDHGTVEYLIRTTLNPDEETVLRQRFENQLPLSEVSQVCGHTKSVTTGMILRIIRKLRHPRRAVYLRYGVAGMIVRNTEQIENRSYLQGYQEGYKDRSDELSAREEEENIRMEKIRKELPEYIDDLHLSPRVNNALHRAGISRVVELLSLSKFRLLSIPSVGVHAVDEICMVLEEKGFSLRKEPSFHE